MKKLSILGLLLFANANIAAMEKGVTVPSTDGGTEKVDILSVLLDDAVVYLVETNGEVGTVENFWNNIIPRVIEEYIIPERQQEFLERVAELKLVEKAAFSAFVKNDVKKMKENPTLQPRAKMTPNSYKSTVSELIPILTQYMSDSGQLFSFHVNFNNLLDMVRALGDADPSFDWKRFVLFLNSLNQNYQQQFVLDFMKEINAVEGNPFDNINPLPLQKAVKVARALNTMIQSVEAIEFEKFEKFEKNEDFETHFQENAILTDDQIRDLFKDIPMEKITLAEINEHISVVKQPVMEAIKQGNKEFLHEFPQLQRMMSNELQNTINNKERILHFGITETQYDNVIAIQRDVVSFLSRLAKEIAAKSVSPSLPLQKAVKVARALQKNSKSDSDMEFSEDEMEFSNDHGELDREIVLFRDPTQFLEGVKSEDQEFKERWNNPNYEPREELKSDALRAITTIRLILNGIRKNEQAIFDGIRKIEPRITKAVFRQRFNTVRDALQRSLDYYSDLSKSFSAI